MDKRTQHSVVTLSKSGVRPPPVRIISQNVTLRRSGAFSVCPSKNATLIIEKRDTAHARSEAHLTHQEFSVTRAHAYARARKDEGGLRRVLDAVLSGGDAKVAAIQPAPFFVRFIAVLLLPLMLAMPLAPAYANDAPLADRVAADVSAFVESSSLASADQTSQENISDQVTSDTPNETPERAEEVSVSGATEAGQQQEDAQSQDLSQETDAVDSEVAGVTTSEEIGGQSETPHTSEQDSSQDLPPSSSLPLEQETDNTDTSSTPVAQETEAPSSNDVASNDISSGGDAGSTLPADVSLDDVATGTEEIPVSDPEPIAEEAVVEEVVEEVPVLDVPSPETVLSLDALRAQIREEIRGEMKLELRHEVEQEVFRGCKNLDGTGYYCIPDAKSFGAPIIENERNITVVVQQDVTGGDKEIFLVRGDSTMQLTHNADDDVFPVLDPAGDTLVWQTLVSGRWQIAYAHLDDVGVPEVHILTDGENNFNPKAYRGRIVWQAWYEGNWEIVVATPAHEMIAEEALTKDHRILGMNGEYEVRRVTANNAPDMFPSISDNIVSWQALDDGVWQVFAHDLASGETKRISKKGVKSDSPVLALVWNEETDFGSMRLVGQDMQGSVTFDFTQLAKRIADHAKDVPNAPVSNTEIIIVEPSSVRTEEEVVEVGGV